MILSLEQQCVSPELGKRMQELGFPQDSELVRYKANDIRRRGEMLGKYPPAYTVAEMGEILKPLSGVQGLVIKASGKYEAYRIDENDGNIYKEAETEADARAKLLIYLAEHHIINPKELG